MTLTPGEPAPWFTAPTPSNPAFVFDTAAGRYVMLLFLPATDPSASAKALQALARNQSLFDDFHACAFVVVRDPGLAATARDIRGLRWFLDPDGAVSRLYGALAADGTETGFWLLLDPSLRVLHQMPLDHAEEAIAALMGQPKPSDHAGVALHAPILIAPRVFEPELCRQLIDLHESNGGRFTGVMRDAGDHTDVVMDELKRRRDVLIDDEALRISIQERFERRLFPLIQRAMGFTVTRIERYVISCYDASEGGVFHAHRDSTTHATAHRDFACSINLNSDFEGGELRFPEFGSRTYNPPVGGAVVFSCALLHEATRVTQGRRYAFLPFLFDEAGVAIRAAYERRVGEAPEPAV